MFRNRVLSIIFLFVCLLLFSGFTEPEGEMRKLFITYSGSFRSVSIYIRSRGDDSYKYYGRLRRERTKSVLLPGGRSYLVRLQKRTAVEAVKGYIYHMEMTEKSSFFLRILLV